MVPPLFLIIYSFDLDEYFYDERSYFRDMKLLSKSIIHTVFLPFFFVTA